MASLTRLDNKQVFNISNKIDIIGRGSSATIFLDDDGVSRNHAEIFMMSGCVEVIDLNSRNGIFINGKRVKKSFLNDGDKLSIGGSVDMVFGNETVNSNKTVNMMMPGSVAEQVSSNHEFVELKINDLFLKSGQHSLSAGQMERIIYSSLEMNRYKNEKRISESVAKHLQKLLNPDKIIIKFKEQMLVQQPDNALDTVNKELFEKAEKGGTATLKRKTQASGSYIIASPIIDARKHAVGTVYLESSDKPYETEDLLYVRALLAVAAGATPEVNLETSLMAADSPSPKFTPEQLLILGKSDAVNLLKSRINDLSQEKTIMISGPPGTDRAVIANNLHCMSDHSEKPYIYVDCSALNPAVIQEELFGRDGGLPKGKFKEAAGGTLVLNRLTCLPIDIQDLISVYIQSGTIIPMGTAGAERVDLQLIVGVRGRPERAAESGKLSKDLLAFFIGKRLHIPILSDRKEDIPEIAGYYFNRYVKKYHKKGMELTDASKDKLSNYSWPGNDRELQLIMERAVLCCDHKELSQEYLALPQND